MQVKKEKGMCLMTESISSSGNISLSALSDLKSFLRSGAVKSESAENSDEENKTAESVNRDVTRNALSTLLEKSYTANSEIAERNAEEKAQDDANTTSPLDISTPDIQTQPALEISRPEVSEESNPLKVNTPVRQTQSALEINRPEVSAESNALRINRPDTQTQSALDIQRPETKTATDPLKVNRPDKDAATKTASLNIPKQKNAILYELRNTMHSKYSAWDIARKYGISYMQAQEIFVDLNQDTNGVVKEFNLPENSTVSYLV